MLPLLETAVKNGIKTTLVTRQPEDFKEKDAATVRETLKVHENAGIRLMFRSNIHQKFSVIDQKIVWYGSINLMSYGNAEESIMRLESLNIANELIKIVQRTPQSQGEAMR